MKYVAIWLVKLYQKIPGSWHNSCRFTPTCSNYAIEAIDRYGSIHGTWLATKRVCRCNPWGGFGYDPVPSKGEKE